MNPFDPALESVLSSLQAMRASSDHPPRASVSSLQLLRRVVTTTVAPRQNVAAAASPAVEKQMQPTRLPLQRRASGLETKAERLEPWRQRVGACLLCPHLASSRTQTVFGVGNPEAELMFIGEAPGADEDRLGEPFVGRAGQLLTRIIETMGLSRAEVYIANVLKCRPDMPRGSTGNRAPTPAEMETCLPYLQEQIGIIEPKVLVALGATAVEGLLKMREPMRNLRGQWRTFNDTPLMVTYHPAYLLRNQSPAEKRKVWEDMLQVLERLDRPITDKQRKYFL
jgi:DNA polymerase